MAKKHAEEVQSLQQEYTKQIDELRQENAREKVIGLNTNEVAHQQELLAVEAGKYRLVDRAELLKAQMGKQSVEWQSKYDELEAALIAAQRQIAEQNHYI